MKNQQPDSIVAPKTYEQLCVDNIFNDRFLPFFINKFIQLSVAFISCSFQSEVVSSDFSNSMLMTEIIIEICCDALQFNFLNTAMRFYIESQLQDIKSVNEFQLLMRRAMLLVCPCSVIIGLCFANVLPNKISSEFAAQFYTRLIANSIFNMIFQAEHNMIIAQGRLMLGLCVTEIGSMIRFVVEAVLYSFVPSVTNTWPTMIGCLCEVIFRGSWLHLIRKNTIMSVKISPFVETQAIFAKGSVSKDVFIDFLKLLPVTLGMCISHSLFPAFLLFNMFDKDVSISVIFTYFIVLGPARAGNSGYYNGVISVLPKMYVNNDKRRIDVMIQQLCAALILSGLIGYLFIYQMHALELFGMETPGVSTSVLLITSIAVQGPMDAMLTYLITFVNEIFVVFAFAVAKIIIFILVKEPDQKTLIAQISGSIMSLIFGMLVMKLKATPLRKAKKQIQIQMGDLLGFDEEMLVED